MSLAPGSFDHPVLSLFKDAAGDDLAQAVIDGYRSTSGLVDGASAAARYGDGEIFLAMRDYGNGRVLVTTTALDARMGGLPARPVFVPLVHELTNWLAGGQMVDLNVRASWKPTLSLPAGGGLSAHYRAMSKSGGSMKRIDPMINFNWEQKAPRVGMRRDRFEVTWEGTLMPPISGEYRFVTVVDDTLELKLDGDVVIKAGVGSTRSEPVKLTAGQIVGFEAHYEEEAGDAFVRLKWERPDGVEEVVPSSVFSPISRDEEDLLIGESEAVDPIGRDRGVSALLGRRGKLLEVDGSAIPGEYKVGVPDGIQDLLSDLKEVPVVVEREGGESRLDPWTDDDRLLVRKEIDLIEVRTASDILAALRGEGFGREIWKILALAALVLFFLEGLLARWVSKSRKAGEEVKVEFEKRNEIPEAFLDAVSQTKGGAK